MNPDNYGSVAQVATGVVDRIQARQLTVIEEAFRKLRQTL